VIAQKARDDLLPVVVGEQAAGEREVVRMDRGASAGCVDEEL
jgi:hypothetical protein